MVAVHSGWVMADGIRTRQVPSDARHGMGLQQHSIKVLRRNRFSVQGSGAAGLVAVHSGWVMADGIRARQVVPKECTPQYGFGTTSSTASRCCWATDLQLKSLELRYKGFTLRGSGAAGLVAVHVNAHFAAPPHIFLEYIWSSSTNNTKGRNLTWPPKDLQR